jgi:CDP-diacylglycerol--serine O-phosphatidyltransferase
VTAETLSQESGKVTYFEGTPIPTSIVLVLMLAIAAKLDAIGSNMWFGEIQIWGSTLHPLTLLFGLSGSLMISRIRVPKP